MTAYIKIFHEDYSKDHVAPQHRVTIATDTESSNRENS